MFLRSEVVDEQLRDFRYDEIDDDEPSYIPRTSARRRGIAYLWTIMRAHLVSPHHS